MVTTKKKSTPKWVAKLVALDACSEAVEWSKGHRTIASAWRACERAEWMLWLLGRSIRADDDEARKRLVTVACECARLALPHVPAGEERPRIAIETAECWVRGEATIEEVRAAARASDDAADAADAAANAANAAAAANAANAADAASAAYAAYAAANAADAAANAADAAANAADAASAANAANAARAAAYAARAAADDETARQCADIVRQHFPKPPRLK